MSHGNELRTDSSLNIEVAGGTFAPSIYIGACLGGALGRMIEASLLEDFGWKGRDIGKGGI